MSALRSKLFAATLFAFALAMAAPAEAARKGIAFAQAPEQSVGFCTGINAVNTLNCARAKCAAGGAPVSQCLRQAWCYPGGWSADIFVQISDGPHFHEFVCGMATRAAAEAAVKLKCDIAIRPNQLECKAVRFFDEAGTEFPVP
jgi:uncharacterized low-complexity protein